MRKKSFELCGFTVVMGIFGAFLRWLQATSVFEPETGLARPNAFMSYALALIILATAAALIFWVRSLKNLSHPDKYPEVMAREASAYPLVAIILGALIALGGVMTTIGSLQSRSIFDLISGLLAIVCAISLTMLIRNAQKNGSGAKFFSLAIVLFLCFWLVATYKACSSDPVIWHFAPRLLAVSASLLAFFYVAGFAFERPRFLSTLYFCQLSSFLCIITLADPLPLAEKIIFLSLALSTQLISLALINNIIPLSKK